MKILVVLPRFPYPLEKGDKLRAYHQIRCLAKNNDVSLFCVSHKPVTDKDIEQLKPYCSSIKVVKPSKITVFFSILKAFFSIDSLQISGYWNTKKIRMEYLRFERKQHPDVLYCQMIRTMEWVKKSKVPKVLDFQDCLSKNVERRMYKAKGLKRKMLHYEFKMLRSCEYDAFSIYDAFTIISRPDRDAIPHRRNDEIAVLPNGVDTSRFYPRTYEKKYDLLFCGNMHYPPNIDATLYLTKEVMPLVWKERPDTTLMLAGANPVSEVRKLQSDRVTVTGWVEDMTDCYAKSKLFVAPMQIGTGLQNKLLEAMAMKLPCITSMLANSALCANEQTQVAVAHTPQDYADKILQLLGDSDKCATLAQNGYEYVLGKYTWDTYNAELEQILNSVRVKN
ncbi:MAG: glycosyltransferase [Bacteroidales bacterium]|nr:glycosyltransferase [Bacteroidales bacterium]